MVGIAGYRDEEKRARRAGKPRKATLEFFFGVRDNDGDDDQDFDPRADGPREFEHWRNGVDRALTRPPVPVWSAAIQCRFLSLREA